MFLLFGLLLIYTAIQLFRHRDQDPDIEDNASSSAPGGCFPVTDDYHGGKLFTRIDGKRMATPLFIVLIAIGSTDMLFALDSIPAVFGVTEEPYIVFVANAFALLGPAGAVLPGQGPAGSAGLPVHRAGDHPGLHRGEADPALAARDINPAVPEIPTMVCLAVILVVLAVTTVASLIKTRNDPTAKAHAGSIRAHKPKPVGGVRHPAPTPGPARGAARRLGVLHPHAGGAPAVAGAPTEGAAVSRGCGWLRRVARRSSTGSGAG